MRMRTRIIIIAILISLIVIAYIGARDKISQAFYRNKIEKVKKLCDQYFKIKYSPSFESIEYKVIPFIDTSVHNKENDIFLVEHTIRNKYTYDSLLKIHHTIDDLPNFLKASVNLQRNLYFMVTNEIIIEPIDSITFRANEIHISHTVKNILKADSLYKSLFTMSNKIERLKKKLELIKYIEDRSSESNIDKLEEMINSEISFESAIPNRGDNIFLDDLVQTKDDWLIDLLKFRNNKRKRIDQYNYTLLHFKQDLVDEISRMESRDSNIN